MGRLTDNDRHIGPFIFGKTQPYRPLSLVFSTGGGGEDDSDKAFNHLMVWGFGWVARLPLPLRVQPFRIKHFARTWDAATVARMGRDWYYETFPREYGFRLNEGFLQVLLGPQTHDSVTTKSWSKFLPWTQWRHVRRSLFDAEGKHFYTEWSRPRGYKFSDCYLAHWAAVKACPTVAFEFDDFDGKRIQVATRIEERLYLFGEGWFKWLSLFRKPMLRRSLDLDFSEEVGPEKGSWKGGTTGSGIEMLPGDDHESAFRRYCDQEHRSKYQRFRITFVGLVARKES